MREQAEVRDVVTAASVDDRVAVEDSRRFNDDGDSVIGRGVDIVAQWETAVRHHREAGQVSAPLGPM